MSAAGFGDLAVPAAIGLVPLIAAVVVVIWIARKGRR